jgi:GrpB-like predicted nucleotidyltransferase (UPF0157 family)
MKGSSDRRPRIEVVPYDPNWPREFERSSGEVKTALGANLLQIHHIGSTSIAGVHAKPVIDMLAVVADLAAVDHCSVAMARLGYEVMGEFGIDGRRYFRRDDSAGRRTHQVHTFAEASRHVARHLAFRDYMRAHPTLARQYGELKQRLAKAHPHDMAAYMDGKDSFIKEMESRALEWVESSSSGPATA